jgi:NAD(P)-dependent dehydrogenase (short-subunit alcohol dehydrogenase family)
MPNNSNPTRTTETVTKGFRGLAGKRAVITGGAGGIALAAAMRFAAEGVSIAIVDLNADGAAAATEKIKAAGGKATAIAADVTSSASVEKMFAEAADFMGGVDILLTCAGGYKAYGNFEDMQEDDWDRVIALNLKSVFLCCKAAIPYMKKGGWGRIVNLGSIAGRSTSAGQSPAHYGTAKAGVAMLTQYIAKDVAKYGITANTVAPSTTKTERVVNLMTPDKSEAFTKATPVGYLAEPEDIAGIILYLASEDARYVTGVTYDVNGGRLMLV